MQRDGSCSPSIGTGRVRATSSTSRDVRELVNDIINTKPPVFKDCRNGCCTSRQNHDTSTTVCVEDAHVLEQVILGGLNEFEHFVKIYVL